MVLLSSSVTFLSRDNYIFQPASPTTSALTYLVFFIRFLLCSFLSMPHHHSLLVPSSHFTLVLSLLSLLCPAIFLLSAACSHCHRAPLCPNKERILHSLIPVYIKLSHEELLSRPKDEIDPVGQVFVQENLMRI